MKSTYTDLMALFSSAATGGSCSVSGNINLGEIYALANEAGVWTYVFSSLKMLYNNGKISIEKDTFDTLNKTVILKTVKASKRRMTVHKILGALEKEGINVIILKGESLSHLYKQSNLRISSDTDILIDEKDEEKTLGIIESFGAEIHKKSSVSHHTRCTCDETGYIEVHTDVYEDYIDDLYFKKHNISKENPISVKTDDGFLLKMLSVNDGLYFLTFHLIKHYVSMGCGLRQVMDLLLYMKYYKDEIDFEKYEKTLENLNFDGLIKSIIGIGIEYFHLDKNDFYTADHDKKTVEKLACDIIESGAFGKCEEERKAFNDEFLKIKLKKGYLSHKISFAARFFAKSASFKYSNIISKYQYVKKHRILLPTAYIHHILYIIAAVIKRPFMKKAKKDDGFINNRLSLFEQMRIIKR